MVSVPEIGVSEPYEMSDIESEYEYLGLTPTYHTAPCPRAEEQVCGKKRIKLSVSEPSNNDWLGDVLNLAFSGRGNAIIPNGSLSIHLPATGS